MIRGNAQIAAPAPLEITCNLMSRSTLRKIGFERPILHFEFIPVTGRSSAREIDSLHLASNPLEPGRTFVLIAAPTPRKTSRNPFSSQHVTQNWFRTSNLAFQLRPVVGFSVVGQYQTGPVAGRPAEVESY